MSGSSASRRADTSLPVSERSWPCSVSSRVWNAHLLHSAHPGGEERRTPRSRRARTRSGFCVRWTRDHRPLHRHACGGGCNRGHELPGVSSQLGTQERGDVLVAVGPGSVFGLSEMLMVSRCAICSRLSCRTVQLGGATLSGRVFCPEFRSLFNKSVPQSG